LISSNLFSFGSNVCQLVTISASVGLVSFGSWRALCETVLRDERCEAANRAPPQKACLRRRQRIDELTS
jgi:hypothetical protein